MAIRGEKEFDTVFRIKWPDGSSHYIKALGNVERQESGTPIKIIGTNWDVTPQKETVEALINALRQTEAANQAKNGIPHEYRPRNSHPAISLQIR